MECVRAIPAVEAHVRLVVRGAQAAPRVLIPTGAGAHREIEE